MGIFEECLTHKSAGTPRGGKVDSILNGMNKQDRESLLTALHESKISASKIAEVLTTRGQPVGKQAISLWRSVNTKKES